MSRADSPPDIAGLTFVRKLGSGGYADVFLYDQATPLRKVAVKVLRETGLSAVAIGRFTAEANAMARLEHPYIVPVYATGTTLDHRPYIAMMYYPKPSLAERARTERLSVANTLVLGIQLGSAVETAHRSGLLHRDIKPANVLTNAYGRPGLTDFGIAGRMVDSDDDDVGVSVPWSPPETLYATGPATVRSDVYSLAATLWQVLVGRSPFEIPGGDNAPFALMRRIRDVPPPTTGRADVPASLDRLLRAAMAKDAILRPASALELVGALQAIEQEMRLPRTPVELANTEEASVPRHQGSADSTQVRSPLVISPVTSPPATVVEPGTSAEIGADKTRRPNRRVAPVAEYDSNVVGATVLRPANLSVPPEQAAAVRSAGGTGKRLLAIGLGVLLVGAISAITWAVLTAPTPPRPDPTVSVSQAPPEVDQPVPAPGRPVITCSRTGSVVSCEWTYTHSLPSDQFEWKVFGSNQQVNHTGAPKAVINNAPSGVCVQVKVFRLDGKDAPAEWTKGCEQ